MLPAVRFYTYSKRFEEAYTAAMRPLTEELDMAQPAVDILLFLANNPGMDTARDICTYRHLKPTDIGVLTIFSFVFLQFPDSFSFFL